MQIRVLAFISIFVAGAAHSTGDALTEIAKCAGIADSAARLKCFDAAASGANGAAAQQAREAPGPPPAGTSVEDFGKPPPPPTITRITATVVELARTARGRALFVLDNGQVWRQLDGDDAYVLDPQPGKTMKVAIARGVLPNYSMTIEGRNALVKVRRVK